MASIYEIYNLNNNLDIFKYLIISVTMGYKINKYAYIYITYLFRLIINISSVKSIINNYVKLIKDWN